MIGLDTNVLVRYLAQDDEQQSLMASRLLESLSREQPGFVSLVVLVETVSVLEACYRADAAKVAEVVRMLLRADSLVLAQAGVVSRALHEFETQHGDFSDTLITQLALQVGCSSVQTFDAEAAKRSGMALIA